MAVTAAQVKELRDRTGAGMMECKKALVETGGDMEIAIDQLRKSGLAQADKKASRVAAEGKIALATSADGKKAVLVEVNCETDFVAKDGNFNAFADAVANNALQHGPADVAAVMLTTLGATTIEEARQALVAKIGENIQVRRFESRSTSGVLGSYIHSGKIGVLLELTGGSEELAKDLAMHVAALNPKFVAEQDVPAEFIAKEKEIAAEQFKNKPPQAIAKIVEGKLEKFYQSFCLLDQGFVKKNSEISVKDHIALVAKQLGDDITIRRFVRFQVGEVPAATSARPSKHCSLLTRFRRAPSTPARPAWS
jgi:elongation factor Ts